MKIYLVMANVDYESSTPIVAYKSEQKAANFASKCGEHELTQEPWPEDVTDSEYEKFMERRDKWQRKHPAKGHYNSDSYTVFPVELKP